MKATWPERPLVIGLQTRFFWDWETQGVRFWTNCFLANLANRDTSWVCLTLSILPPLSLYMVNILLTIYLWELKFMRKHLAVVEDLDRFCADPNRSSFRFWRLVSLLIHENGSKEGRTQCLLVTEICQFLHSRLLPAFFGLWARRYCFLNPLWSRCWTLWDRCTSGLYPRSLLLHFLRFFSNYARKRDSERYKRLERSGLLIGYHLVTSGRSESEKIESSQEGLLDFYLVILAKYRA